MNIFARFWRWLMSLFWAKELSITIVGLPSVGKSTLVRAIANENTEDETVPTIGPKQSTITVGGVSFKVCDIGGHQNFRYLWDIYLGQADVILYVLDSADVESIGNCEEQIESLFNNDGINETPVLIIANKQDIDGCLSSENLRARLKLDQFEDRRIELFCISAKMKTNIEPLIKYIIDNF